jgi:hypothetical protein
MTIDEGIAFARRELAIAATVLVMKQAVALRERGLGDDEINRSIAEYQATMKAWVSDETNKIATRLRER